MGSRPSGPWLNALLVATLLTGCARLPAGTPVRWIADEPDQIFDERTVFRYELVAEWGAGPPAPVVAPGEAPRNAPLWATSAPLDASAIDRLEVSARGFQHSELVLLWVPERESPGAPPPRLALQGAFIPGAEEKVFSFVLWSSPAWRGALVGASLHTDAVSRQRAAVRSVRALRRRLDSAALGRAAREAWKTNLGGELRNALLVPPATPSRRHFAVPRRNGVLRFGFGVPAGTVGPVTFAVVAHRAAETPRTLFERTLATGEIDHWFDAEVDLTPFAGEAIDLELATSAARIGDSLAFFSDPVAAGLYRGAAPDILLVSLDTLRADRLSAAGYGLPTTPHLDRFAALQAVRFASVVAQAPSTLPSHTSLFTGLNAFRHGANQDPAASELQTLAETLRAAGYRTLATTGGGMLHPRHALTQGFDVYRHWQHPQRRDDELPSGVAQIRRWLDETRTQPRFLFLHTYEIHSPYRARQPFFHQLYPDAGDPPGEVQMRTPAPAASEGFLAPLAARYVRRDRESAAILTGEVSAALASALYDSAVACADDRLGALFDELAGLGLLDRMVVAVVSDHGESFGEHGMGMHGNLYDDNLMVPLLLSVPGRAWGGRVIERQVRLMDLMPTLLELAGAPVPADLDAVSLLPLLELRGEIPPEAWSYAVDANRGLALRQDNRLKYLFNNTAWRPLLGREEVYDLRRDRAERVNLAAHSPDLQNLRSAAVDKMRNQASGWRLTVRNGGSATLAGRFSGELVGATRLRVEEPTGTPLSPQDEGRVAAFELAAGATARWLLDGAPAGSLRLTLGASTPLGIDLPQQPGARCWLLSGASWLSVEGRSPKDGETGIGLEYRGTVGARRAAPGPVEEEHMRQLAALGYLH